MTALYAVATVTGVVALFGWIVSIGLSGGEQRTRFDIDERFGARGRAAVAAVTGFGLAGMSATFAGWSRGPAFLAAAAAAVVLAAYTARESRG